ncbi:MAG: rRNA pseudouridine synthase, partial [Candidatus Muirbacterium halophilum]|nr:rRNA pseudouridine synthase [Candidatus Muirbacterium halophilum]
MVAERIQKLLSNLGIMSRRKTEELIKQGKILVNHQKAELGTKVDLSYDKLVVDGREIKFAPVKKFLILNKPAGYLCTHNDPEGRPTIFDLIKDKMFLSNIGRLDFNSEGLVLLTNDGDMKEFLSKPENKIEREYKVKVNKIVYHSELPEMMKPRRIDGRLVRPQHIRIIKSNRNSSWIAVVVCEGVNREIRKLCEMWGHKVSRLIRVRFGPIKLFGVAKGQYRALTYNEERALINLYENREKGFGKNKKNK